MTPLPRGTCKVCGANVALRKGSLIREHKDGSGLLVCPGSGDFSVERQRLRDRHSPERPT